MKININDMVRFKPTEIARQIYARKRYYLLKKLIAIGKLDIDSCLLQTDANGFVKMPLWEVMNLFGEYCYNGTVTHPILNNELILE